MRTVAAEAGTDASASASAGTTECKIDRVVMVASLGLREFDAKIRAFGRLDNSGYDGAKFSARRNAGCR